MVYFWPTQHHTFAHVYPTLVHVSAKCAQRDTPEGEKWGYVSLSLTWVRKEFFEFHRAAQVFSNSSRVEYHIMQNV